jgi:hypothetical protein
MRRADKASFRAKVAENKRDQEAAVEFKSDV